MPTFRSFAFRVASLSLAMVSTGALFSIGTFSPTAHAVVTKPVVNSVSAPVSVFSTYPSPELVALCNEPESRCEEDSITPDEFVSALKATSYLMSLQPYAENNDYELLIANVGKASTQFAEITLQWRGMEINSHIVKTSAHKPAESGNLQHAETLIRQWEDNAVNEGIFTAEFLYRALEASNYQHDLAVPNSFGQFTKLDTQLFADPFSGAITRYTHPAYEDALVDVIVYPFTQKITEDDRTLLNEQLDVDLAKASAVAKAQQLTLTLSSPAAPYKVKGIADGWRLGIAAESEKAPTLYASTYVFRKHDKIIKIATTFPTDFSDPLVDELIQRVDVPKESLLMKRVRKLL
ncbi:MAG: hypothetical protein ABNH03_11980 [Alteromonas sp.]|jgi:hypothetical protein|uniref:hypothetical protein n=1 Tax=Alteromonas sp. TaxID=232 RepID=UPI0032D8D5E0